MLFNAKTGTDQTQDEQFTLFCRAIIERDEYAWSQLYQRYHHLVLSWIVRCDPLSRIKASEAEALVNAAFAKLAQFLTPEKLRQLPTKHHLFRYFKLCTQSVVTDERRRQRTRLREESLDRLEQEPMLADSTDTALANVAVLEVWQDMQDCLWTDEERVLAYALFVQELPPTAAFSRYQQHFPSLNQFYRVRRRVLERVRHHPRIQDRQTR